MAFAVVSAQARRRELAGISYVLFPPEAEELRAGACARPTAHAAAGFSQAARQAPGVQARQAFQRPPAGQRPWQRGQQAPGNAANQAAGQAAGQDTMSGGTADALRQPGCAPRPGTAQRGVQAPQRPPRQMPAQAPSQMSRQATAQPVPGAASARAAARQAGADIISAWPADWQALFARTKPGKVAWTYYGLGHDLCGKPNAARRTKLAELIAYLRLPKGTHTFWPIGLPALDEDGNTYLAVNTEIFWQGLQLLSARMLIIMGSPAARSIGITGHISPTMPMRPINGMLTLLTWDIDDLDTENHFLRTRDYLRQTLSPLIN